MCVDQTIVRHNEVKFMMNMPVSGFEPGDPVIRSPARYSGPLRAHIQYKLSQHSDLTVDDIKR